MDHMAKKVKGIEGRDRYQYAEALKKKIVNQLESGALTAAEAMAQYQIRSVKTLKAWIIRFAANPDLDIRLKQQHKQSHRRQVAFEIAAGRLTPQAAARENKVGLTSIHTWMRAFKAETQAIAQKRSPTASGETSTLQDAAAQLKFLQLKVIALETMIDIAEKQFDIDIRKKSGTKQ